MLVQTIAQERVERVIIAPDGHDQEEILDVIRALKTLGVKVSVLPRLLEVVGSAAAFDEIDGVTLLGVRQAGLSASTCLLKRTMDMLVASVALLLLGPLLLIDLDADRDRLARSHPLPAAQDRARWTHLPDLQIPVDGHERRRDQGQAARA